MPLTEPNPQVQILRLCAEAAPNPWYPSAWVRNQGVARDEIDPYLDQLRMGGLIRLTDWEAGHGQGYALTAEGAHVAQNPRELDRFLAGKRIVSAAAPQSVPDRGATALDRGEAVRAVWLETATPVITRALLFANVMVFVCGALLALQRGVPL